MTKKQHTAEQLTDQDIDYPGDDKPREISHQELSQIRQFNLQIELQQSQLLNAKYEMQLYIAKLYIKYGIAENFVLNHDGQFLTKGE